MLISFTTATSSRTCTLTLSVTMFIMLTTLYRIVIAEARETFIGHVVGESYHVCMTECDTLSSCVMAKYYRHHSLCKLYSLVEEITDSKEDGVKVYKSTTETNTSNSGRIFCPPPSILPHVKIWGNMREKGAKIKYECLDGTDVATASCLENGTWSKINIMCNCEISVRHSEIDMTRVNDTTIKVQVTCYPNYNVHGSVFESFCDIRRGTWSYNEILCQNEFENDWQYVFSYSKYSANDILSFYRGTHTNPLSGWDFRRSNILDSWLLAGISRVKLELIQNEAVVRYIIFNAVGLTSESWFSMSNVVSSSWDDLNSETQEGQLKIYYSIPDAQFFAYKLFPLDAGCFQDRVWLAVGDIYDCIYPCDFYFNDTSTNIMYSRENNASQFILENIGFADRLILWVDKVL